MELLMKRHIFLAMSLWWLPAFADSSSGDGLPYIEILPRHDYVDTQNACKPHGIVRALEDRYFKELSKGLQFPQVTYAENKVIFQYSDASNL